jgi:hypothetical protein
MERSGSGSQARKQLRLLCLRREKGFESTIVAAHGDDDGIDDGRRTRVILPTKRHHWRRLWDLAWW